MRALGCCKNKQVKYKILLTVCTDNYSAAGVAKPAVGHVGCPYTATAGAAGGVLEVPWVPPWTMSYQRAWGRTPVRYVHCIFIFNNLFSLKHV